MTSLADEMVSVTRNLRPRAPKSEISSGNLSRESLLWKKIRQPFLNYIHTYLPKVFFRDQTKTLPSFKKRTSFFKKTNDAGSTVLIFFLIRICICRSTMYYARRTPLGFFQKKNRDWRHTQNIFRPFCWTSIFYVGEKKN